MLKKRLRDVVVQGGGELIVNDTLIVNGNMTIGAMGTVTRDEGVGGVMLSVLGQLEIELTGAIDLTGKGLAPGEYGPMTGLVVDVSQIIRTAAGAMVVWVVVMTPYWPVFMALKTPSWLGGGGISAAAGAGGGAMIVEAGILLLNGQIVANGADGSNNNNWDGGGGAGGSLWLNVGHLAGTGGVSAVGGSDWAKNVTSSDAGYAGGGGRIRIDYDTKDFEGGISTAPGEGYLKFPGQAGTVYMSGGDGGCGWRR